MVAIAIGNNPYSLEFASDELKNDVELAIKALIQNPGAFSIIGDVLKNDSEFIRFVKEVLKLEFINDNNEVEEGKSIDQEIMSEEFSDSTTKTKANIFENLKNEKELNFEKTLEDIQEDIISIKGEKEGTLNPVFSIEKNTTRSVEIKTRGLFKKMSLGQIDIDIVNQSKNRIEVSLKNYGESHYYVQFKGEFAKIIKNETVEKLKYIVVYLDEGEKMVYFGSNNYYDKLRTLGKVSIIDVKIKKLWELLDTIQQNNPLKFAMELMGSLRKISVKITEKV